MTLANAPTQTPSRRVPRQVAVHLEKAGSKLFHAIRLADQVMASMLFSAQGNEQSSTRFSCAQKGATKPCVGRAADWLKSAVFWLLCPFLSWAPLTTEAGAVSPKAVGQLSATFSRSDRRGRGGRLWPKTDRPLWAVETVKQTSLRTWLAASFDD
jgi:hypothetical protein